MDEYPMYNYSGELLAVHLIGGYSAVSLATSS